MYTCSFPEFWCVDDEEALPGVESMVLHYYSQRGPGCAALNVGIVKEVAKFFFNLEIEMTRIATQDVDESPFTSWKIIVKGPYDAASRGRALGQTIPPSQVETNVRSDAKCPFGYK